MRARRGIRLLVAATLLVTPLAPLRGALARPLHATVPKALPRLTPAGHDGLTRALANGSITQAQYALERALSLFHLGLVEARFGPVDKPDPHDATMILRDLRIRKDALSGSDLRQVNSLFARPNDNHYDGPGAVKWTNAAAATATVHCFTNVCIHWVTISKDAPPLDDVAPADGVPDWVATTDAALENVWTEEVTNQGYRPPESDMTSKNHGPDGRLDVYLADLLPDGLFGYTTTDDPKIPPPYDVSAYMVLDNDYVGYGYSDPTAPLDVTAAHEFFHAVQFAYDAYEDRWMMEATAVWMEDQVYDAINDNYYYLRYGPLGVPGVPLDKGGSGLHQYGAWIYFRFLSEYLPEGPAIIRDIWEEADGAAAGPDYYSTAAIARAIALQGESFGNLFATFAEWAAAPDQQFEEGANYPAAKRATTTTVRASEPSVARTSFSLDHLANAYAAILPGSGVSGTARLRVSVDGPIASTAPQASIVILRKDGTAGYVRLALDANGNAAKRVEFGKGTVREVIVILTNASRRFRDCRPHSATTIWSCSGLPRDDNLTYAFSAKLV